MRFVPSPGPGRPATFAPDAPQQASEPKPRPERVEQRHHEGPSKELPSARAIASIIGGSGALSLLVLLLAYKAFA